MVESFALLRIREVPGSNLDWRPAMLADVLMVFLTPSRQNAGIVPHIRPLPFPFTFFLICYSLSIQPFDSKQPTSGPYSEPDESSPHPCILFLQDPFKYFPSSYTYVPSNHFSSGFLIKTYPSLHASFLY
jgi:hypothetical protein